MTKNNSSHPIRKITYTKIFTNSRNIQKTSQNQKK